MLRHALEGYGHAVVEARDEAEARRQLAETRPTVVLSDLRLPQGDGFGVLRAVKEQDVDTPVIVMTAYGSIEDAVKAMKEGALDFLAKPVDLEHLRLLVSRAIEQRRLVTENVALKEELAARHGMPRIIGDDPTLTAVLSTIQRVAGTGTTVLLEGESGTGKELFARALHALSERIERPFVAINCAAISDTLLESELFGYEKGAFTGAVGRKLGKFEIADRGTLFLDEIGDLPLGLQAKILRALEERCFERVGGTTLRRVDVRLVAATNKNLRARRSQPIPRGFVLPPLRVSGYDSAAARTAERHSAARALFHRALLHRPAETPVNVLARGRGRAPGVPVARQCARAPELHRAGRHSHRRRHDLAATPEPLVRAAGRRGRWGERLGPGRSVRHAGRRVPTGHGGGRTAENCPGVAGNRRKSAPCGGILAGRAEDVVRKDER